MPHETAWDRTRTSMVRGRRLTASLIEIFIRFSDVPNADSETCGTAGLGNTVVTVAWQEVTLRIRKHDTHILRSCDRASFNKFLCNKTNYMHQFHKFILSWNSTCFGQFVCPSSGIYTLYTLQWYMSFRFVDSFQAGPGWNLQILLHHIATFVSCRFFWCLYTDMFPLPV